MAFPSGYADSDETYPVVYVLDANSFFGTVTETIRVLRIGKEFPKVLIVGVGYAEDGYIKGRFRDYSPTPKDDFPGSGGAEAFLRFVCEELIPFVDSNYRTDLEDRCLLSDSLSGLFALYALFHRPDPFTRCIIGSPGMGWDEAAVLAHESAFAANNTDLPVTVFLSVGSLEKGLVRSVQSLAEVLQGREYANLRLITHTFENETHWSVAPATISRGLRMVFG